MIVEVKNARRDQNKFGTYINFLTDDARYGSIYCTGYLDFQFRSSDHLYLKNAKISHHKSAKSELNYNLILTQGSEATLIQRNEMISNIKVYPQERKQADDVISLKSGKTGRASSYAKSTTSKYANGPRKPASKLSTDKLLLTESFSLRYSVGRF